MAARDVTGSTGTRHNLTLTVSDGKDSTSRSLTVSVYAGLPHGQVGTPLGSAPPEGSVGERLGLGIQHLAARRMRKQNVG